MSWTETARRDYARRGQRYPSDLTDREWGLISPFLPEANPTFSIPERRGKLDEFAEMLLAWLKVEAGRSRKQKRTVKQLHADLVSGTSPAAAR